MLALLVPGVGMGGSGTVFVNNDRALGHSIGRHLHAVDAYLPLLVFIFLGLTL